MRNNSVPLAAQAEARSQQMSSRPQHANDDLSQRTARVNAHIEHLQRVRAQAEREYEQACSEAVQKVGTSDLDELRAMAKKEKLAEKEARERKIHELNEAERILAEIDRMIQNSP